MYYPLDKRKPICYAKHKFGRPNEKMIFGMNDVITVNFDTQTISARELHKEVGSTERCIVAGGERMP